MLRMILVIGNWYFGLVPDLSYQPKAPVSDDLGNPEELDLMEVSLVSYAKKQSMSTLGFTLDMNLIF